MNWVGGRRRNVRRTVTFTPEEWDTVTETYELWARGRGASASFGRFAREMLTDGSVRVVETTWDPEQVLRQLRPIGVNVNQIARRVNEGDLPTMLAVADLRAEVNRLTDVIGRMCADYRTTVREA